MGPPPDLQKPQRPDRIDAVTNPPSAIGGAVYLIFIQIASRALTFIGNQFLLRYLSPSLLGLAVQLELLSVTTLYFARESLRVALQRQPTPVVAKSRSTNNNDNVAQARAISQGVVNMSYLVVLLGLFTTFGFGYGYLHTSSDEVLQSTDLRLAFRMYAAATLIELFAEPCFVVIQQESLFKARARAETGAAISRCLTACLTAITMHAQHRPASVLPFAVGQLCYATTLFGTYMIMVLPVANAANFSLLPRKISRISTSVSSNRYHAKLFFKPLLNLAVTFYGQSIFKLLLTQGDSLILSFLTDLRSQGAFALASNYGGLLSRLLFQPIEESSRNIFGRLLAPDVDQETTSAGQPHLSSRTSQDSVRSVTGRSGAEDARPRPEQKNVHLSDIDRTKALNHLSTTVRLYLLLAFPLTALLPHVLPCLVSTLIGERWATAETSQLLAAYSYYIPFLALNGILDAFVTSVASPRQLHLQSLIMLVITVVYGGLAMVLMSPSHFSISLRSEKSDKAGPDPYPGQHIGFGQTSVPDVGPAALVWANCLNMSLRIVYSIWFIRHWLRSLPGNKVGKAKEKGRSEEPLSTLLLRRSTPSALCTAIAAIVALGLRTVIDSTDTHKSFLGIKGLNSSDMTSLITGGIVLLTSILFFEHRFLFSVISNVVPLHVLTRYVPASYLAVQKQQTTS